RRLCGRLLFEQCLSVRQQGTKRLRRLACCMPYVFCPTFLGGLDQIASAKILPADSSRATFQNAARVPVKMQRACQLQDSAAPCAAFRAYSVLMEKVSIETYSTA